MKFYFLLLLSLLLSGIILPTTAKTTETDTAWALSFYPLQTGNYWEYSEKVAEGDCVYYADKFSVEIVGDTLLNNGKSYKILQKQYVDSLSCEYIFERVDSLSGNVYRFNTIDYDSLHTEYLIDSLYAQVGDTVLSQRYYRGKTELFSAVAFNNEYWYDYLGKMQFWKIFGDVTRIPGYDYELGENVGIRRITIGHETRPLFIELQYAIIDGKEYRSQTNVDKRNAATVQTCQLLHNYPNPFNPTTTIKVDVAAASRAEVNIYNSLGQLVAELYNGELAPGAHELVWNAQNEQALPVSSGIYFVRVRINDEVQTRKMMLIK